MKPSKLATTEQIKGLSALANAFDYPAASDDVIERLDPAAIHFGIVAGVHRPDESGQSRHVAAAVERSAWMVWDLRFVDSADGLGAEVHMMLPLGAVAALPDGEVEDRVADLAAQSAREEMAGLVETMEFIDEATEEIERLTGSGG